MKFKIVVLFAVLLWILNFNVSASTVDELLKQYNTTNSMAFSSRAGQIQWSRVYTNPKSGESRSCATCHTKNLRSVGQHVRTKKVIDPLAPSLNIHRLTKIKHVNKWFKRNCLWTIGRECTNQEKGDFILFISAQ